LPSSIMTTDIKPELVKAPKMATKATHSEEFLKKARRAGSAINLLSLVAPRLAGRLAFRIFCTPRNTKIKGKDLEFLYTSTQQTFTTEDLEIRTYTWHPALPDPVGRILFVHGWESNSARWRKYVKLFCEAGWEVSAFDAPAHGQSEGRVIHLPLFSRVIKAYMEEFGVPDVLVGHSLGAGAVVMSMSLFDAPPVRKAALLGCFGSSERVLGDFGKLLGLHPRVMRAIDDVVQQKSGLRLKEFSIIDKSAMLPDEIQGLVLHDTDDEVAPVSEAQAIADNWGVPLIVTEGYGHRMQHKAVVGRVFEFATMG
jgi:pimeloyl-ACP methyl ester carboxylesterase